jgi:hypothetical protein
MLKSVGGVKIGVSLVFMASLELSSDTRPGRCCATSIVRIIYLGCVLEILMRFYGRASKLEETLEVQLRWRDFVIACPTADWQTLVSRGTNSHGIIGGKEKLIYRLGLIELLATRVFPPYIRPQRCSTFTQRKLIILRF